MRNNKIFNCLVALLILTLTACNSEYDGNELSLTDGIWCKKGGSPVSGTVVYRKGDVITKKFTVVEGKQEGDYESFTDEGKLRYKSIWKNNKPLEETYYFDNTETISKTSKYDESGDIIFEVIYNKNGKIEKKVDVTNKIYEEYFCDGTIKSKLTEKGNRFTTYYPDGSVFTEEVGLNQWRFNYGSTNKNDSGTSAYVQYYPKDEYHEHDTAFFCISKDGKYNGVFQFYDVQGDIIYEGNFSNGKKSGTYLEYRYSMSKSDNFTVYEETYSDNTFVTGVEYRYYPKTKDGLYKNWKAFHQNEDYIPEKEIIQMSNSEIFKYENSSAVMPRFNEEMQRIYSNYYARQESELQSTCK